MLTISLLSTLRNGNAPWIANVASQAYADTLDFANLQGGRHYGGPEAYLCSKLINVFFTAELHRREGS